MEMSLVNAASSADLRDAASTAAMSTLKTSLDMQKQTAQTLLQAVPEPQRYNNPPGVGGTIDVKA